MRISPPLAAANLRAVPQARVRIRNARCIRRGAVGRVRCHRRHRIDAGLRCALRAGAAPRRPFVRRRRLGAGDGGDSGAPGRSAPNGFARACSRPSSIRLINAAAAPGIRILMIQELSPREFLERRAAGAEMTLLDVREDWETQLAPVPSHSSHSHGPRSRSASAELDPSSDDGRHLPLRRPQPRGGALSRVTGIRFGIQSRRRHLGVVARRRSEDPAVLNGTVPDIFLVWPYITPSV